MCGEQFIPCKCNSSLKGTGGALPLVSPHMGGRGCGVGPLWYFHPTQFSFQRPNHGSWASLSTAEGKELLFPDFFFLNLESTFSEYLGHTLVGFIFWVVMGVSSPSMPRLEIHGKVTSKGNFPCSEAAVAKHGLFPKQQNFHFPLRNTNPQSSTEGGGQKTGKDRDYQQCELIGNLFSKWKQKFSISLYAILFLMEINK